MKFKEEQGPKAGKPFASLEYEISSMKRLSITHYCLSPCFRFMHRVPLLYRKKKTKASERQEKIIHTYGIFLILLEKHTKKWKAISILLIDFFPFQEQLLK